MTRDLQASRVRRTPFGGSRFGGYLVQEILPYYGASLAALLLLLLGMYLHTIIIPIIARGTSPALVARFMLYSLPAAAGYGIPLALLFAGLLGITRLSQDSEIKAAFMLGLSPREFLVPVMSLGLVISGLAFMNNELLVPWSAQRALEVQKDILIQSPETVLTEGSFFTDALGRSVFIQRLERGGIVEGITVIQAGGSQGAREVIQARRGVLDEAAGMWRLEGVRFIKFNQSRVVLDASAETGVLPVRGLAAGTGEAPELTHLPLRELWARISNNPGRVMAPEWTAIHRKFAEPLAATAFALFALAVGLYSFRSNFSLGIVSVLFLTFVYYATWSVANTLGAQGMIPAWAAGWTPVALYAVAGAVLLTLAWRR
jgi:lipopolysaccharide export system permease protein